MADPKVPVELLKEGKVAEWNEWRKQTPHLELDLSRVKLNWADLRAADLSEAKLSRAKLIGVNLVAADLNGANLVRADLRVANLSRVNLSGASLIGADLGGAVLSGANLSETKLSLADLSGADLREADLRRSTCHDTRFVNCDLTGIQVKDWVVSDAVFEGGTIKYAYLTQDGANGPKAYFKSVEEFVANWKAKRALEVLTSTADPAFFPMLEANLKELDSKWLLDSVEFKRDATAKGIFSHPDIDRYKERIEELEGLVKKTMAERMQALSEIGQLISSGSVTGDAQDLIRRGSPDVGLALEGAAVEVQQMNIFFSKGMHQLASGRDDTTDAD